MTVAERMIVSATVKARAEEEDGWKLELDVPQFRSKYPTKVSRVKEAVAKLLPPRAEPYSVVLVRENLIKDKKGDLPWHYYWGLEGLATPAETAAKAAEPEPLEEREHRIMRSTALAQAVATYVPGTVSLEDERHILDRASVFYAWLRDGPAQAPASTHSPAKATAPAGGGARGAKPPATGGKVTEEEWQKIYAFAKKTWDMTPGGVHMVLGKSPEEWTGTAKEAQDLLLAAKKAKVKP